MKRILLPVAPLLFGVAMLVTGQGLQGTLLPVRAHLEGFSTIAIGLMGGAYFLGFTLGCLRGSSLVKKVGHVRVFAAMTAAASAAPLLHGLWPEVWLWFPLRCMTGYCIAMLYIVIESWLNEQSTNETRGAVFSAYTLITLTVMAVGQQMITLYDPRQMALFALASATVSLAAIPVVMSIAPSPPPSDTTLRLDLRRLLRISPAGVAGCLAAGLANGSFWALGPVFVSGFSADVSVVAWFMSATVLGGAAGQWPLGRWSDHVDRRWVLACASLISLLAGFCIWLFFASAPTPALMLMGAAWGAFALPVYAVAVAHANDNARAGEYVILSSGLLLVYGLGAIVGPFLASLVMARASGGGLFLFSALVHALLLAYVLFRIGRRSAVPEDEHRPFTAALASAQTASHVYQDEP